VSKIGSLICIVLPVFPYISFLPIKTRVIFLGKEIEEFILECECDAKYRFQGTRKELDEYLDSMTWMCDIGRHVELGRKGDYLSVVEERDELSGEPEIESKKENEYTIPELQEKFGTSLEHIGFGMFRDLDGNIWNYRLGKGGERLYSK